jgi:hypothetical protein
MIHVRSLSRRAAFSCGTAIACLAAAAAPTTAEVLVTVDGKQVQTRGPWEERGRQIVYTDEHGNLVSIRASLVDLEASRAAGTNVEREEYVRIDRPKPKPVVSKAPPGRSDAPPVVITQGEVSAVLSPEAQRVAALFGSLDGPGRAAMERELRNFAVELIRLDRLNNLLLKNGIRNAAPAFRNFASRFANRAGNTNNPSAAGAFELMTEDLLELADLAERRPVEAIARIRGPILDLRGMVGKDHRPGLP